MDLLIEEAGKMEVTLEKESPPAERVNLFKVACQPMLNALIRMNNFFTMTKIDLYKAGIDRSGEGRDNTSD